MYEQRKKILLIGSILALGVALVIIVVLSSFADTGLSPTINTPQELWPRKIDTQNENGVKVIQNEFDMYSLSVPEEWNVSGVAGGTGGLKISYNPSNPSSNDPHADEGLLMSVFSYRSEAISIEDWINSSIYALYLREDRIGQPQRHTIDGRTALKIHLASSDPEHSSFVYVLRGSERIYVLSCVTSGAESASLSTSCEQSIQTFSVTNG